MSAIELDDLLVRVARGDQVAFETLYDRMASPVYGVVRKVLQDPSQSEEVTQEILREVWRDAERFDPAMGDAATWMTTIAHRRAIDRIRSATAVADSEHRSADIRPAYDELDHARVVDQRGAGRVVPPAAGLVTAAVRLLPKRERAQYAEEFRSELWEIAHADGRRRAQLAYAARQVIAALRLRAELRVPRRRGAVP